MSSHRIKKAISRSPSDHSVKASKKSRLELDSVVIAFFYISELLSNQMLRTRWSLRHVRLAAQHCLGCVARCCLCIISSHRRRALHATGTLYTSPYWKQWISIFQLNFCMNRYLLYNTRAHTVLSNQYNIVLYAYMQATKNLRVNKHQRTREHSCSKWEGKKHILAKKLSSAAPENVQERSGWTKSLKKAIVNQERRWKSKKSLQWAWL